MGSTKPVGFMTLFFAMLTSLPFILTAASSPPTNVLHRGSSLSVERPSTDVLTSEKGTFKAGFYQVGENAFSFAIWFTEPINQQGNGTVVWMANRDWPVNGKASRLAFRKGGDLALHDADGSVVWTTTNTDKNGAGAAVFAELRETGNLLLLNGERRMVWQSFDYPTDTLLPGQPLTRFMRLVSNAAEGNYSRGYYVAHFNDDNVLSFIYEGANLSSLYWPYPEVDVWGNSRTRYNSSRYAILDDKGQFTSSDYLKFTAVDFGLGIKRRLTMDTDGILRLYSLNRATKGWEITWMPSLLRCRVHGLCGLNGICMHKPRPTCTCPPGFHQKDTADWTQGCEPEFDITRFCKKTEVKFMKLPYTDFYGHDGDYQRGISFEACKNICLSDCNCPGFGYILDGRGQCFPKTLFFSGQVGSFQPIGDLYLKVPIQMNFSDRINFDQPYLNCSKVSPLFKDLDRHYAVDKAQGDYLKYPIGFVIAFGVAEIICVALGWAYLHKKTAHLRHLNQGSMAIPTGFRRFTFDELKKATNNFRDEIGRGASGVVCKGVLEDERVVAVKKLKGLSHGSEAQFWSEVSTIGRINHLNLVTMLGFCAEKQKRLLVYEYLENGSLEKSLFSNGTILTWEHRFNIAVGTAKALAYLHEECLEWVLHCDVKPQNVLLDENFQPKLADFGLSKLFDRGENNISEFSRVRGTRGYVSPEWILNQPITSKVDVYSYGVLVLELVTGRSSFGFQQTGENGEAGYSQLIPWIREMVSTNQHWVEEIADPQLSGIYDKTRMKILIKVALQCVEEERDARPSMSQVVDSITLACFI